MTCNNSGINLQNQPAAGGAGLGPEVLRLATSCHMLSESGGYMRGLIKAVHGLQMNQPMYAKVRIQNTLENWTRSLPLPGLSFWTAV